MDADRIRWDKRFLEKSLKAPKPPGFFQEFVTQCPEPGTRVLDVACGDGAAALWFAARGFQVSAWDISAVALDRLKVFAAQKSLSIDCRCEDLDLLAAPSVAANDQFDFIVMAHFKPSLALLKALSLYLAPSGKMLLTTFNQQHHQHHGFSKRFCLESNEFVQALESMECLHYQSVERGTSYMDDYCWQRLR